MGAPRERRMIATAWKCVSATARARAAYDAPSTSPPTLRHPFVTGEVGVRAYVTVTRTHKLIANGDRLLPAVLQHQPAARAQVGRGSLDDPIERLHAAVPGEQRCRGLVPSHFAGEVGIVLRDVRWIRC